MINAARQQAPQHGESVSIPSGGYSQGWIAAPYRSEDDLRDILRSGTHAPHQSPDESAHVLVMSMVRIVGIAHRYRALLAVARILKGVGADEPGLNQTRP